MILFLILAVIWAKIRKYRVTYLLRDFSLIPLVMVELFYWVLQIMVFCKNYALVPYASYISSAYLIALIFPMLYHKLYKPGIIGAGLVVIGTLLNNFVIAQNGGKMPVFATLSKLTGYYSEAAFGSADSIHVIGSDATKFKFLTDIFDVGTSIMSLGDILIHSFTFIIVYYTIKALNQKNTLKG